MKILHVTLGNPENHQGGLNKYCSELMQVQEKIGHEVYVLYPGKLGKGKKIKILRANDHGFRLVNALPVAITYGIDNPRRYMVKCDELVYKKWLTHLSPNIIHVHSVQGIHKEFFTVAKQMGIKLVFTTHDYYPICFKAVLYDKNGNVCDGYDIEKCSFCNRNVGLSENKQRLMQSDIYQKIKCLKIMGQGVKKRFVSLQTHSKRENDCVECMVSNVEGFDLLHKYYIEILRCFDVIHCNSIVTYNYYRPWVCEQVLKVIPITRLGLKQEKHTKKNTYYSIAYLGGESKHKGYEVFNKAIDIVAKSNKNWRAFFWGGSFSESDTDLKKYKGYFNKNEEKKVWEDIDILVAPSQCPETFGFIIIEAIARGIPVISSELYGSSFLLEDFAEILIYKHDDCNDLAKKIMNLLVDENYERICKSIDEMKLDIDMEKHVKKILNLYGYEE